MSNDRVLRIAFDRRYPWVNPHCARFPTYRPNKLCTRPGIIAELYGMIAAQMNATIQPIDATKVPFQEQVMNLKNGTYDMFGYTAEFTVGRLDWFEFSEPLYYSSTQLAVRRANSQLNTVFDFFTVYGWDVYAAMAGSFLVFTLLGLLIRLTEFRLFLRSQVGIADVLWKMLRIQLVQWDSLGFKLKAGNASVLAFSFFQCSLVVSLYSSWVLYSLVRTKPAAPFDVRNLDAVIRSKQFSFVAYRDHEWYYEMIEKSFASPFYEIRHAWTDNPVRVLENETAVIRELNAGRGIAVIQDDTLISHLITKECEMVFLPTIFPPQAERIMMRKGHPLMREVNASIAALRLMILKTHHKYKNFRPPSKCGAYNQGPQPLTIAPYVGVLILYFVGVGIGFVVFGSETFLSVLRRRSFFQSTR